MYTLGVKLTLLIELVFYNEFMKRVLFYSSVKTKKMFSIQSYYRNDIQILRDLGFKVLLSNSVFDYMRFWKYDIGFFYFYRYSAVGALFSKLFRKKNVFTGGIDYLEPSFATPNQCRLQKIFFKICNVLSDANIIVSTTDYENIKKIYNGKIPRKCSISFHVIDWEKFKYTGESKQKVVTTIAWMVNRDNVYRKGVDKTIKAFSIFKKKFPEYRLIIAGPPGEGSKEVVALISQLNLEDAVEYRGTISEEEKVNLLKHSLIYSQLSIYEGFGIAAIEALAAGCILVHSGKGGLKDAVGNNGYVVNIGDENEIVEAYVKVASNILDLENIRNKGMKYAEDHFTYNKRFDDFRKIFDKIIV